MHLFLFPQRLVRINYSHQQRSTYQPSLGSATSAARVYSALMRFDRVSRDPSVMARHKMEEGECLAFDNRRVLHGRSAFGSGGNKEGEAKDRRRKLVGWYHDWDEIWSRINVLREKERKKE